MMAAKAQLFGDTETYERILVAPTPGAAKDLGRRVRGFDDERWKAVCVSIVIQGNLEKFRQNTTLSTFLLGTANRVLVEASPVDRIWGIGLAADDPRAVDPGTMGGAEPARLCAYGSTPKASLRHMLFVRRRIRDAGTKQKGPGIPGLLFPPK